MPDLSLHKNAKRLRIYIGESDRWRGKALDSVILDTLKSNGVAGATVFRGMAGFGAHSHIRSAQIEVLSFDLPVVIETVDTPEKIQAIIEIIYPMVREGLITVEDVQIVKYTHRFLNPLPADRLVSEVMTREIITLPPDRSIHQAWKVMLETKIKAIPVIDRDGKVIGMLTDEDLLERGGIQQRLSIAVRMNEEVIGQELQSLKSSPLKVEDVMTRPVTTVLDTDTLGFAAALLVKAGLKRLPVINSSQVLVGVISRLDILRQITHSAAPVPSSPMHTGVVKTVEDIMSPIIPMVNQDDDLSTLIEKFTSTDSHRLIVVDADGKAIGLVSDSDMVARIQPEKQRNILDAFKHIGKGSSGKETAFDLMSPGVLTCPPQLPVVEAVQLMLKNSRKWLVVIDNDNKPVGLVDRQIILEALIFTNK